MPQGDEADPEKIREIKFSREFREDRIMREVQPKERWDLKRRRIYKTMHDAVRAAMVRHPRGLPFRQVCASFSGGLLLGSS